MESTYEENNELSSRGGNQAVAPQSTPKEALAMGIRPPDTKKHGASARAEKTPEEKKTKRCGTSTEKNRHYAPEERKKQMTGRPEGGIAPPSEHVTTPTNLNQPKLRVATYNVAGLKMDLTIREHYSIAANPRHYYHGQKTKSWMFSSSKNITAERTNLGG